jgi:prepilin-type processing-associated H-X9-DG protein
MKSFVSTWPSPSASTVCEVDKVCKIEAITDGTSNTAVWVECGGRGWSYYSGTQDNNTYSGMAGWAVTLPNTGGGGTGGFMVAGSVPGATTGGSQSGEANVGGGASAGATCAINCTNQSNVYSFHSGGAYMLFADGSVHFVSANITFLQLGMLLTRSFGEVIDQTWFY